MKDFRIRNTNKMCYKNADCGSKWHLTVVAAVLYSQPPSTYTLTLSGKSEWCHWCALLPDSFQASENCSLLRWNLRGEIQIAEASRAHQAGVNKQDIQFNQ
jgi:hypothetical protein